jgi:hypothetical protein
MFISFKPEFGSTFQITGRLSKPEFDSVFQVGVSRTNTSVSPLSPALCPQGGEGEREPISMSLKT